MANPKTEIEELSTKTIAIPNNEIEDPNNEEESPEAYSTTTKTTPESVSSEELVSEFDATFKERQESILKSIHEYLLSIIPRLKAVEDEDSNELYSFIIPVTQIRRLKGRNKITTEMLFDIMNAYSDRLVCVKMVLCCYVNPSVLMEEHQYIRKYGIPDQCVKGLWRVKVVYTPLKNNPDFHKYCEKVRGVVEYEGDSEMNTSSCDESLTNIRRIPMYSRPPLTLTNIRTYPTITTTPTNNTRNMRNRGIRRNSKMCVIQ